VFGAPGDYPPSQLEDCRLHKLGAFSKDTVSDQMTLGFFFPATIAIRGLISPGDAPARHSSNTERSGCVQEAWRAHGRRSVFVPHQTDGLRLANFVFVDSSKADVGRTGWEHHLRTCPEKSGEYPRRVSMF
jgi:hypothetical protein